LCESNAGVDLVRLTLDRFVGIVYFRFTYSGGPLVQHFPKN